MRSLGKLHLHPFLASAFPIAQLLASNLGEVQPAEAARALVVSLLLTGLLLLALKLALRSWAKAAVLASLTVLLFFSYGHVYESVRNVHLGGLLIGRHRFLLAGWAIVWALGAWAVARRSSLSAGLTAALNAGLLAALLLPLGQILLTEARASSPGGSAADPLEAPVSVSLPVGSPPPDVYYIILDSYARQDVLLQVFDYDNEPFLRSLESLGFTVARESRSNYALTRLSLPSALNMNYIETLGPPLDPEAREAAWLDRIAKSSAVRRAFESLGYRIVAFESAYGMTDWIDSDLYLSPRPLSLSDARAFSVVNAFEAMLFQTSMGRLTIDAPAKLNAIFGTALPDPNAQHRERILFALDRLGRLGDIPGPKFVFIHIMSPHPPYIFTAEGGIAGGQGIFTLADQPGTSTHADAVVGYRNQVAYLNSRVLPGLEALLASSPTPPIIVLQGDNGASGVSQEDRMKVLNAYYLPEGGSELIYPQITPVNSFRVILDRYFHAGLPLLEDRSYYSHIEHPFQLTPIP